MSDQAFRDLLTQWSAGLPLDVDRRPPNPAAGLGNSCAPSCDDTASTASSLDIDRYPVPGAFRDSVSGNTPFVDDKESPDARKSRLRMLTELLSFSGNGPKENRCQPTGQFSRSQLLLHQLLLPCTPPSPSQRSPTSPNVGRSLSFKPGDDRSMTATSPQQPIELKSLEKRPIPERPRRNMPARKPLPNLPNGAVRKELSAGAPWKEIAAGAGTDIVISHEKSKELVSEADSPYYRALSGYVSVNKIQLGFEENEVLRITRKHGNGWWHATRLSDDKSGLVPSRYLDQRPIPNELNRPDGTIRRRQRVVRHKKTRRQASEIKHDEHNEHNEHSEHREHREPKEPEQFLEWRDISQKLLDMHECAVCGEQRACADFPDPAALQCSHKWHTCRDCVRSWISVELESKGWDKIKCSEPECKTLLTHADILHLADSETFQRYDTLATRAHLSSIPNFRWCLSPSCPSGQIHDSEADGPIFKCAGCSARFCTKHEMPWHSGETCKQYDRRLNREHQERQEKATARTIAKTTKKCPGRNCGWNIEKNNGCDHMTCRQCRHEFCWECSAPYDPIRRHGNSRHRKGCKYHSDNVK